MPLIEAVSLSGLLGDVGMVAGVAAALISAVLAALVLVQGREIKGLRDELESESDRARQAEASLTAEMIAGRQAVQPAPPAVAPAPVPLAARVPAAVAPNGSATGEWDAGDPDSIGSAGMPALGSATAATAVAGLVQVPRLLHQPAPEHPPATPPAGPPEPAPRPEPVVIPAPVPAAGGAAAALSGTGPLGRPETVAAGGISKTPRPPVAAKRRRSPIPLVLGGAVLVAAVVFGVILFAGDGGESTTATTATTPEGKPGSGQIVAVLNGTPVAGLAGEVSSELARDGFKRGRVATARDQQQPRTVVAYMPGHLIDAEAVVQSLGLKGAPVPADDPTQAIACPDPATCNVEVIVTVGADRTR